MCSTTPPTRVATGTTSASTCASSVATSLRVDVAVDEVDAERGAGEPEQQQVGARAFFLRGIGATTVALRRRRLREPFPFDVGTSLCCGGHDLLPGQFDVHLLAGDAGHA